MTQFCVCGCGLKFCVPAIVLPPFSNPRFAPASDQDLPFFQSLLLLKHAHRPTCPYLLILYCQAADSYSSSPSFNFYSCNTLSLLPYGGYFLWVLIFMESPKRPSINFVVLNFVTATSPGAWHCCTT